jgi:hypothetical protein
MIDLKTAMQILDYDIETGEVRWKSRIGTRSKIGAVVGSSHEGYLRVKIFGRLYMLHRLVWLIHTGEWPKYEIDHINGNRHDNRISNLRDVPKRINQQNQHKARSSSTTGLLGVSKCRHRDGFLAQIRVNRKTKSLGFFATKERAHEAYLAAKRELHSESDLANYALRKEQPRIEWLESSNAEITGSEAVRVD